MGEQVHQVGELQGLLERNPLAFVGALLALYAITITTLWVRSLLRVERLQRAHGRELDKRDAAHGARVDELMHSHYARVDEMQRDALERGIKLEHIVQGMLRLVSFGGEVKPAKRRVRAKPTTNPRLTLPLEQEAPTQVLEEDIPDEE